jgi:uncharacterized protein with von Willebrand factor type A (vWA) domain
MTGKRTEARGGHLLRNLLLFGRVLRGLGLNIHIGRMLDAVRVLDLVGVRRKRDLSDALKTVLVHRQQDLALFDEAFEAFWRAKRDDLTTLDLRSLGEQRRFRRPQVAPPGPDSDSDAESDSDANENEDRVDLTRTYSARKVLRTKDFAQYTVEEFAQAQTMMAGLDWDQGMRKTRRWSPGKGSSLDPRRLMRSNLRYGGEIVDLPHQRRRQKPRPLVLICDVSGSMERYTRMLLHFVHSIASGPDQVAAFLFATRLTRITGQLAHKDIDEAVTDVARAVPDWAGGTRIGEALKTFNFDWTRRVLGRGAVVLVISDGWDRGEPDLLQAEMARLQRSCHRLVWLNPLLGAPDYEPATRGMQAALPYIDNLLPVHNMASLVDLAHHLSTLPTRREARRQQAVSPKSFAEGTSDTPKASQRSSHRDANPSFKHPLWGHGN